MSMSQSRASSMRSQGGIYESETQRLQREVDHFTKQLEHERKRMLIMDEEYKTLQQQSSKLRQKLNKIRPSTADQKKNQHALKTMENRLDKSLVKYNEAKAKNRKLRAEVDVLRREKRAQKQVSESLHSDIGKLKRKVEDQNTKYSKGKRFAEETNIHILALKAKHEKQKEKFDVEIKQLQDKLKEKEDIGDLADETMSKMGTQQDKSPTKPGAAEFSNPSALLKKRLSKWISTNKEKKKLIDQYLRNVRIIQDAFDQIKEATGISSIDQIVTTFIKAQEQNYSLYNYVNMLNQQIDQLDESNKDLESQIRHFEMSGELSESQKQKTLSELEGSIKQTKTKIENKQGEISNIKQDLHDIQASVEKMTKLFGQSKFMLAVANPMSYEEGTQFNEQNVTYFLAELEEYISSLLTYISFKQDNPHAALSSIPLDKLPNKDYHRSQIDISAPVVDDVKIQEQQDDDSEIVVGMRELRKKFNFLVDNNMINLTHDQAGISGMNQAPSRSGLKDESSSQN